MQAVDITSRLGICNYEIFITREERVGGPGRPISSAVSSSTTMTTNVTAYGPLQYHSHVRGLFEKFVDSPYYSESKLCGGAVMVSFSKHLT
jgi:hypothetical protein